MRTVLITGASSGIGLATARLLAQEGWRVLALARRQDRLTALAEETGGDCVPVVADLTAPDIGALVAEAVQAHGGRLDALVNNAGIFATADPSGQDAAHLERLWAVNVRAPVLVTRACLDALASAQGIVVNVSSVAAEATFAGCGIYSATKSALETWSRILREELRARRIRVCVVAPGATATEAFPGDLEVDPDRLCQATDVAKAIQMALDQSATANFDRLVITPPSGPL